MNQLVLSRTATLVLSGTRSSCYRGPELSLRACISALSSLSNFTNQKSFGFPLTDKAERRVGGDWRAQAASSVLRCEPHTLFLERPVHGP
ncbi:hypothetical protein ABIF33_004958 [Bradyrhizobium elkanii]